MGPEPRREHACRAALAYRGATHVTNPVDLQSQPVTAQKPSERIVPGHVSDLMAFSAQMPSFEQLARAIDVINTGFYPKPGQARAVRSTSE